MKGRYLVFEYPEYGRNTADEDFLARTDDVEGLISGRYSSFFMILDLETMGWERREGTFNKE